MTFGPFRRQFEMSRAQRHIWSTQRLNPNVPINTAQVAEIIGPLDIEEFVRRTSRVVGEAKFTQLRFAESISKPAGVYDPSLHHWVEVVDLRHCDDPRAAADAMMR